MATELMPNVSLCSTQPGQLPSTSPHCIARGLHQSYQNCNPGELCIVCHVGISYAQQGSKKERAHSSSTAPLCVSPRKGSLGHSHALLHIGSLPPSPNVWAFPITKAPIPLLSNSSPSPSGTNHPLSVVTQSDGYSNNRRHCASQWRADVGYSCCMRPWHTLDAPIDKGNTCAGPFNLQCTHPPKTWSTQAPWLPILRQRCRYRDSNGALASPLPTSSPEASRKSQGRPVLCSTLLHRCLPDTQSPNASPTHPINIHFPSGRPRMGRHDRSSQIGIG